MTHTLRPTQHKPPTAIVSQENHKLSPRREPTAGAEGSWDEMEWERSRKTAAVGVKVKVKVKVATSNPDSAVVMRC
ncbi:hypothetical protein ACOMHN_053061 [Nucella lapillus]